MAAHSTSLLFIFSFLSFYTSATNVNSEEYALLMPHVQPLTPETYLCTTVKLDEDKTYYITGFKPNATSNIAHHMLLYGCITPGKEIDAWNCGEMQGSSSHYKKGQICASGSQIVYAWAKDAPKLELPQGVGFKVGKNTDVKFLVLQVHYLDVSKFIDGATDDSGVILTYTETAMPRSAGVYMLGTNGFIPAKKKVHMETACVIDEDIEIHPIGFRTHTHSLGTTVSGYKVNRIGKQQSKWTLLGKKNPQLPQMFYPVNDPNLVIKKGDILAARCTMVNTRKRMTKIGPTSNDEMCNFYLLYWVEGPNTLDRKYCFTMGPPFWYWKYFPLYNIPEIEASKL